jgi:uncharacterized protein YndB with AHSA1/START domain
MIQFTTTVTIRRSVEEVFGFVVRGENGPKWNSAVREVQQLSEGPVGVGTRYRMLRELPGGKVENVYEITGFEPNRSLSIKIVSGPTPFVYHYSFEPSGQGTRLTLDAEVEKEGLVGVLGMKARIAPDFVLARFLKSGVESNFKTLKHILESGRA